MTNIESPYRNAVIIGPADTPFEDGTFRLVMHFEEQYPNKPPSVKFISEMFHPNVYATGELCLDILQNRWSPTYDVAAVLTSIQRYGSPTFSHVVYFDEVGTLTVSLPVCLMTRTRGRLRTSKLPISTKTTAKNTTRESERPLRRAGRIEQLRHSSPHGPSMARSQF